RSRWGVARQRGRRVARMRERLRGDWPASGRRGRPPTPGRRRKPSDRRRARRRRAILAVHSVRDGGGRGPGGRPMRKVGVIGAGMTLFRRRLQETGKEMCFEATKMALDSAGLTRADIDMVVNGTAPDAVHGVKKEDIARVAVKNKRNAVGHPCAQLADPKITVDDVLNSEVMAWPVQRLDISPPSDGASAIVLASEDFIRRRKIKDRAWMSGVGWCIDSTMWTDRDLYFPEYVARAARTAYKRAKISDPRKEIDFAEPYDPFDYKELHHLEGLLLAKKGEAPILTREGVTERDGDLPVCPSGGLMGVGNPIAATMGQKIGELFWQLTNQAGKRQIPHEVHTGVAQAWGDLMQYGSVVVMSS